MTPEEQEKLIAVLLRMEEAPDRPSHDKKCHWCYECGDNLAEALKLLHVVIT